MVFTGLVAGVGTGGFQTTKEGECWRLVVNCEGFFRGVALGDSIAVNGCCLTAVELSDDSASFDVMAETRRLTCLADKTTFNVEKAMTNADRLGGHVVQGHVHGVGKLLKRIPVAGDDSVDFWFEVPACKLTTITLCHKGSICIEGVSLTVAELSEERHVRVSVIPHTRKVTTFGTLQEGDRVNIEFDSRGHSPSVSTDEDFMRMAIAQGDLGRVTAPPNPWVGCVIVKDGEVIGRGYHHKAGTPHAEIVAMANVANKKDIEGSTVYTTLEPCSHHGRTGPCCEALVEKGVARCVVAVCDPDEKVSGRGNKYMRDHGIQVTEDVCTAEAEASLLPYLRQRRTGLPFVVMKIATTLDGFVACADSTSQWITGPEARASGHKIRAESQAIIVGSGTALADNPRLTVRTGDVAADVQPLRVVLDRRGRVADPAMHLLSPSGPAKTLIFTQDGSQTASETVEVLSGAFTLRSVLEELAKRGILQVMVEGGGAVHTAFVEEGLCDRLVLFQGATVFGEGRKWLQKPICSTIAKAKFYELEGVEKVGNDVRIQYAMKSEVKP